MVRAPTSAQLTQLAHTIARRVGRLLEREGPLDFISRLAALVPPPRLNLTRFHGVFALNSPYRARLTPAEQRSAMRWAKRLKRVFQVDVETCPKCGGLIKVIACIEDPPVIERILRHLASKDLPGLWPNSWAPPTGRGRVLH